MNIRELREQAARVRDYWHAEKNRHLSAEGATLLSMVENIRAPADAMLVSRAELLNATMLALDLIQHGHTVSMRDSLRGLHEVLLKMLEQKEERR